MDPDYKQGGSGSKAALNNAQEWRDAERQLTEALPATIAAMEPFVTEHIAKLAQKLKTWFRQRPCKNTNIKITCEARFNRVKISILCVKSQLLLALLRRALNELPTKISSLCRQSRHLCMTMFWHG